MPTPINRYSALVPDTSPTSYSAVSANGAPVSITLPRRAVNIAGYYPDAGLDVMGVGNPYQGGWPALVIMAPSPIRPFAAGEAITLTDSNNNVIAIRNARSGTAAPAFLAPGMTFTATASGWTGGGFTVEFIGQNVTMPMNPTPYYPGLGQG